MPRYNFKCKSCGKTESVIKKISEISNFYLTCEVCEVSMTQVILSFNASVEKTAEQKREAIKEEAAKIADKVRSGDISTISQIYGEK